METPSERRVDRIGREAFDAAVTSATRAATQEVARIHRIRLVSQAAAVSFLASCCVFALVAYIAFSQINNADVANARYNCRVLTRVAQIMGSGAPDLKLNGKPQGFLSSDTLLRQTQASLSKREIAKLPHGPLKALLSDPATSVLERRSLTLQAEVANYWAFVLARQLQDVANVNCTHKVG